MNKCKDLWLIIKTGIMGLVIAILIYDTLNGLVLSIDGSIKWLTFISFGLVNIICIIGLSYLLILFVKKENKK